MDDFYPHFSDHEDAGVSDDSDYGRPRKKAAKKVKKPAAKQQSDPDISEPPPAVEGEEGISATGRKKRKDTGQIRTVARSWSDDEEAKFWEALSIHGRDWKACAAHVGTRDHRAIASHAQKAFIKKLLKGEELPEAVAVTGKGYTLSGRPLDPNSSAARAYGLRPDSFEHIAATGKLIVGVHVTTLDLSADSVPSSRAGSAKRAKVAKSSSSEQEHEDEGLPLSPPVATYTEPTDYAKARPRRQVGQKTRMGETTESCELTSLSEFVGPAGTGAPLAQPFKVSVSRNALLVADLHAHLSGYEVIGLLGGKFDADTRSLSILEAFPCRRAAGSDSSTSVELDAESQVEASEAMDERGLIPVGWYHSHPIFAPRPSLKDNENQRNYQALCRDLTTELEPWVGLIVSPYDPDQPSPTSSHQLWVVRMQGKDLVPYTIRASIIPESRLPSSEVVNQIGLALAQLKDDPGRIDLTEVWRLFTKIVEGGLPDNVPLMRAKKLREALRTHLCSEQTSDMEEFLNTIMHLVEKEWSVRLPPTAFIPDPTSELEKKTDVVEMPAVEPLLTDIKEREGNAEPGEANEPAKETEELPVLQNQQQQDPNTLL